MRPAGYGIQEAQLDARVRAKLLADGTDSAAVAQRPGTKALAVLYVPANLVNGDVFTVAGVTFEVDIINTDSGVNTANDDVTGPLSASESVSLLTTTAAPATAINAGDLLAVESEMMKVLRKLSTTQYVVARGRCGTAIAAHAKNLDVIVSDAAPAANVPVGLVTTLTPAAFAPAAVEEFLNAAAGAERATAKAPTAAVSDAYTPVAIALNGTVGGQIIFIANEPGVDAAAVSEEFTNSTDNVWGAATFTGGLDAAVGGLECVSRVATASEELAGEMHFAFPFTVREVIVAMEVDSTGQRVFFSGAVKKAYVESTDVTLPATVVTLRNVGPASTAYITGFASTHRVTVLAFE